MANEIRLEQDAKAQKEADRLQKEKDEQAAKLNEDKKYSSDAFKDFSHATEVYEDLKAEYGLGLDRKFARIAHSRAGLEPYWDEKTNGPAQLPLHQHNVSSKRYLHTLSQVSLPYNSFFPNQSYARTLLDIVISAIDFKEIAKTNTKPQQPNEEGEVSEEDVAPTPGERTAELDLKASVLEQGFDRLMRHNLWAKAVHSQMVDDMMNNAVGVYFFPNDSYKFQKIDFTKMKFPSGSNVDPNKWDYFFMEHDDSWEGIKKKIRTEPKGWKVERLKELLNQGMGDPAGKTQTAVAGRTEPEKIRAKVDGSANSLRKTTSVKVPLVSLFWKNDSGKVSRVIFTDRAFSSTDDFLYVNDNEFDDFDSHFSIFVTDETTDEIRMVKSMGERIHNLCHAYDRAFCKFLDHVDQSSTTFINMDPSDAHKKILHLGSLNIGAYTSLQQLSSNLTSIVGALAFIEAKIDQLSFTSGINKGEMKGEGRGAELAETILTIEGIVQKHFLSRFIDRYTAHWQKVLHRVIKISLVKNKRSTYPEVFSRFYEFVKARGIVDEDLKLDDTSNTNNGLPSHWLVSARKPDGTGVAPSANRTIQLLAPFLSSLPEPGLRYVLEQVVLNAFNDVDAINRIFPDAETSRLGADADAQLATVFADTLTKVKSDFDKEMEFSEEVDPKLSDAHAFTTIPASKLNDHIVFLSTYLGRVDKAMEQYNRREIGRATLHIWLYNLVSTAQGHLMLLRADRIRGSRSEAQGLAKRFGSAFNLLRQVESQANADRGKKLDALQQKIQEQQEDDPVRMKALAALEMARAKQAEVSGKYRSQELQDTLKVFESKRSEEKHRMDMALGVKELMTREQSNVGRPRADEQRSKN